MKLKEVIKSDLYRYGGGGGLTKISKGMRFPGFRYMYYFRKASHYKKMSILGIYYRLILRHICVKYGFQIPATTSIGKGFL